MIRSNFAGILIRFNVFAGLLAITMTAQAEVINISNEQLKDLLAQNVTLIDVRRAEEWAATGLVEGSEQKTFFDAQGKYDANKWLSEVTEIVQPDQPVVLICHVGMRSKVVANWLSEGVGRNTVYNLEKGIEGWMMSGNPTVKVQ